ncbi:MAG: FprA family A-type flavoprotein [Paraprevotella sp.]|nr:FprA family A-type flavoprotein [Paraprevotella sp.]
MNKNITEFVKYIGADDTDLDLFESQYIIPNGISYNSYVILDEKIAVMDTIDQRKTDEWFDNLEKTLNGKTPDYLIVQHMEPDHAANIGRFAEKYPNATIVATAKAIQMMPQFFEDIDFAERTIAVKEGEKLCLGKHTLNFIMAPMVHWPEVMLTYEESEKILFSADAFGKFGALCHEEDWACEARRYYFNIVGKYGVQVQTLLKKASALDIATICPLHGPILTENLGYYIGLYDTWSSYRPETEGVLVAYASIHGNTAIAAKKIADILKEKGAQKVTITDLSRDDMAEAVEDAFRYGKMIVAASSYDAGLFPPMHDFLHHLKIKNFQNRRVGIIENGSWAPCAGRVMQDMFGQMKDITIVNPMVTIRSTMKEADLPKLEMLAEEILAEE